VITGATGFLGGAVARRLVDAADVEVVATGRDLSRGRHLQQAGIAFHAVDLVDARAASRLVRGAHTVIHAAALSSPWGRREAFFAANVVASENVANACIEGGVQRLVHVSTPGIYHDGRSQHAIREDQVLPARAANHYVDTKRMAEAQVLAISAASGLPTLVLRPRAIFGPGDTAILPRLARALQSGRLRRIGDGSCLVDMSYIDNVVDAVLLAADAPSGLAGRTYNISNGEPVRIWDVIDRLADSLSLPRPRGGIPTPLAVLLARLLESGQHLLAPRREPLVTRYGIELLSVDMTLDIGRARTELGYRPRISMDEGLAATFAALAATAR
jgi:nucleoside-diphosphate-sugar epimerase